MCCKKFGSVLAAIAHGAAVIMLLAFFEVMFFLEGWSFTKALLGMISVVALQRFIFKLIIALALTREFKQDTSNIAWWTGKWYSMGWHSMSQPGREFVCKITELGMFAADFILGHIILFLMLPALCVPYVDKFHSVMLFWLRPRYAPFETWFNLDNFLLTQILVAKSGLPFIHLSSRSSVGEESSASRSCTSSCSLSSLSSSLDQ